MYTKENIHGVKFTTTSDQIYIAVMHTNGRLSLNYYERGDTDLKRLDWNHLDTLLRSLNNGEWKVVGIEEPQYNIY